MATVIDSGLDMKPKERDKQSISLNVIIHQHISGKNGGTYPNGFMHCNEHRMLLEKGPIFL